MGTLRMGIDSLSSEAGAIPYRVAADGDSSVTPQALPAITNLQPGSVSSVYFAVRNTGSLNFDYRGNLQGSWGDPTLDNAQKLQLSNVHRFDLSDCLADDMCKRLNNWLAVDPQAVLTGNKLSTGAMGAMSGASGVNFGHPNTYSDGSFTLSPHQYSILRMEFTLDASAGNEFQGKNFTYTLNAQAKQTTAPGF